MTMPPVASPAALVARFQEIAATRPESAAVLDGEVTVSYARLCREAARIAQALSGVDGQLIGLRMQRGWRAIAAMIGIGWSGRAYVPIDPSYPAGRQDYIFADARIGTLIEDATHGWQLTSIAGQQEPHDVPVGCAYVIYTSGSTGSPKGVLVGHANVMALLEACAEVVGRRPGRRWSVFHSFSFDFSVWEIWGPLLEGSAAIIVGRDQAIDPALFAELLSREQVNVLSLVPSAFTYLARSVIDSGAELSELEYVVFGGEAIRPPDVQAWWRAKVAPSAQMVNMYGITETTVHVTHCLLSHDLLAGARSGRTPIGRPLEHLQVRLADADGYGDAALGELGQIVVSGRGLSAGYLGRQQLSDDRFPIIGGERTYLSGDWAARDAAGVLHYAGRRDDQIKVRGHRVEFGEVEATLIGHPQVAEAACALQQVPGGPERLIACVVLDGTTLVDEVRAWLEERLPSHLIPAKIAAVDRLPTTASGKLARAELIAHIGLD